MDDTSDNPRGDFNGFSVHPRKAEMNFFVDSDPEESVR